MSKTITFELPWPPSINHYYRRVGPRTLISKEGRQYRKRIVSLVGSSESFGASRLAMTITACPPDRRRRDLDNLLKAVQDSLQHAGVYDDDGQIDDLHIIRGGVARDEGGRLLITLKG